MHLKRYQRQTVQDALRAVREDLGPEALVLSTRLVTAPGPRGWFGGRFVEITAAASRPAVTDRRHPADAAAVPLDVQRSHDAIAARLEAAGLDGELAREVATAHPRHKRRDVSLSALCATLATQLAPLVATDDSYAPVEVFVGPPGVGKTTTIAKIAAQERVRRGNRLGLIAADGFRVGAVEQLRLYAQLLGSPLAVTRTPYELQTVLEAAAVPVLVDTAGRSYRDDGAEDVLRVVASRSDVRTHLVLAADTPLTTMKKIVERFAPARPSRVVLTKVDETDSLAPVVSFLREQQLRVSYFGVGQRVPEDLHVATARVFAGWLAGDVAVDGAVA
jgi:flagellar biosynthesis protein FlhF